MIQIPLQAVPNQSFSILLNAINYDFKIKTCRNISAFDISINNVPVITGFRAVSGTPIIPFKYLENGNFIMLTANEEYPYYERFGIDQYLIYASQAEIEAINDGSF